MEKLYTVSKKQDQELTVTQIMNSLLLNSLRKGTPLASRVAQGVSGPSSSCVWNPRVFADDARGLAAKNIINLISASTIW